MTACFILIKFRYHVTFATVACGAFLFAPRIDLVLLMRLLALYCCFNVLMYGGIYTWNDIADRRADARHPRKCRRPVASGAVSVTAAAAYGGVLIAAGNLLALQFFDGTVVACFGAALLFNAFYSLCARNLRYLDVVFNSLTHPTRFLMGALLVGRVPPVTHLAALLMLAMALSCLRRQVERDAPGWDARETLERYAPHELSWFAAACLAVLAALAAAFAVEAPGFYAIVTSAAVVVAGGGWLVTPVRSSLRAVWTH